MFPPFWYYLNTDTDESDRAFVVIGKALYIATRYESYCKSLRTVMHIKKKVQLEKTIRCSDEEELKELVDTIYKKRLYDHIKFIKNNSSGPESIYKILFDAKQERNFIAHELTLGLENNELEGAGYEDIIDLIKDAVMKILEAELIVINITACLTHDEPPPANYIDNNYSWVFNDE